MNKMEVHDTKHSIFTILSSKSKWELPFLAKGNARCHLTAIYRIKAVGKCQKRQQRTRRKLAHCITNSLPGKSSNSNFSKLIARKHILLQKLILRVH